MCRIDFTPRWRTYTLHGIITGSQQQRSHDVNSNMNPGIGFVHHTAVSIVYSANSHSTLRFYSSPDCEDKVDQQDSTCTCCSEKYSPAPSTVFERFPRRFWVCAFVGDVGCVSAGSEDEAEESLEAVFHCGLGLAGECAKGCCAFWCSSCISVLVNFQFLQTSSPVMDSLLIERIHTLSRSFRIFIPRRRVRRWVHRVHNSLLNPDV